MKYLYDFFDNRKRTTTVKLTKNQGETTRRMGMEQECNTFCPTCWSDGPPDPNWHDYPDYNDASRKRSIEINDDVALKKIQPDAYRKLSAAQKRRVLETLLESQQEQALSIIQKLLKADPKTAKIAIDLLSTKSRLTAFDKKVLQAAWSAEIVQERKDKLIPFRPNERPSTRLVRPAERPNQPIHRLRKAA